MPVGIKNNNYLNVKNGSDPWMNAGGKPSRSDSKGHAIFSDPAYGVRAGILLLRTYFLHHNLRTILEILSRWAPVTDTIGSRPGADPNNPTEYAVFVSNRMGIPHHRRLELFNPDKTIRNVGQLRGLFYAMAAFEIGDGFKVPDKDFNAGLELVEPGITVNGAGTGEIPHEMVQSAPKGWKIGGSVGRVDVGAVNDPADVTTVQSMLRSAAMILGDPRFDPGIIDGLVDPRPAKSDTVKAIVAFQSRFFPYPDGLIETNERTWRELVKVVSGATGTTETIDDRAFFPFASLPAVDWTSNPRRFSANRAGNRAHAGCDLYFPKGTTIHAITGGTVVRGPYPFYAGTWALEIDHGSFLARYGEVQRETMVSEGDRVTGGQPIARVGHLVGISVPSDMLHLEIYDKTQHGPLTTSAVAGAIAPNGRPYMRRKDLIDPTPLLNRWKSRLPGSGVVAGVEHAAAKSAQIPSNGFCIHIQRVRQEKRDGKNFARTISDYQCYWDGEPIHDLAGQIAERNGPGDNSSNGVAGHCRVEQGTYRLSIHDGGRYKTYRYAADGFPLPGLLFLDTGKRSAILLHPCHSNDGYLSSIGCLNPADGLTNANSRINLADSRNRVIAIIEGLKAKLGPAFPKQDIIPGAIALIEGEPA